MPTKLIRKPTFGEIASVDYRQHPRYRGLLGHWIMGEGGGTVIHDISGRSRHGVYSNATPSTHWTKGQFGPVLNLDGTTDLEVTMGGTDLATFTYQSLTISVWFKATTTTMSDDFMMFWHGNIAANSDLVGLDISDAGADAKLARFFYRVTPSLNFFVKSTTNVIDDLSWHHICGVRNRADDDSKMYIDGVLEATSSSDPFGGVPCDTDGPFLGNRSGDTEEAIGHMDEVRLYNRALTAREVRSLYTDPWLEFEPRRQNYRAAAVGLGIPIAAYHYNHHLGTMAG
jgi:hypothetical protein